MSSLSPDDEMIPPSYPHTRDRGSLPSNPKTNIRLDPDGTLLLGGVMKEEPHYKAHGVMDRSERPQADLVARVYWLGPETLVPPKMRGHRLRCINRLASRTILEANVPDFRIIVCWVNVDAERACPGGARSLPGVSESASSEGACPGIPLLPSMSESAPPKDNGSKESMERTSGPRLKAAGGAEKDSEPGIARGGGNAHRKKRTPYQQESKRARQRERRQAARRAMRQSADGETEPPGDDGEDRPDDDDNTDTAHDSDTDSFDDDIFYTLVELDEAYDETSGLLKYKNIPVGVDIAQLLQDMHKDLLFDYLWRYFNHQTLNLTAAADMQGFLTIKQSEILFLKR
ncbi:hypothetical protein C8A05DRAFT_36848 [Staphylotrichum tortipilum]|uniref:Uncharacterized protein n=1 Tax=Staphylotrichum tortipilum TaxID=2831512 RepID=A0AAN6RR95_9PEZI|nr:hypothetical protein C8A05DRAFT_36848 [Staphylotrichum longicolle]